MTDDLLASCAERLRLAGADPDPLLAIAPDAAASAGGESARDACLAAACAFAEALHAAGFSLYFPCHYAVKAIAEVLVDRPVDYQAALADLAALATSLGEPAWKTFQRGAPQTARAAGRERPWVLTQALALGRDLAATGIDPGEVLARGVPALAAACGEQEDAFAAALAALRELTVAVEARGVVATSPILEGVRGAAEAWSDAPAELPDALGDLRDLVGALQDAGLSPHPVLEHGVAEALPATRERPWLRREVFPLAATLAGQGIDPVLTLQGVRALAGLEPEPGQAVLAWAQGVAADGADPGWLLSWGLWSWFVPWAGEGELGPRLAQVGELLRAVTAHGHQLMLTFRYGLPQLGEGVDLDQVLELSTRIARLGIDPGPPLEYGFAAIAHGCAERPLVAAAALALARAQVDAGRSPWRPLESGLPAVLRAAGADDAAAVALLERLGELLGALQARGVETDGLLIYGISSLGRSAQRDPALFASLLGYLRDLVADLAAAGIDPVRTVGTGLPAVAGAAPEDPRVLERAVAFARELAAARVDPGPLLVHAIPPLAQRGALELLAPIAALCRAAVGAGFATEPLGAALGALAAAEAPEAALGAALEAATGLARDGLDPTLLLAAPVPPLLRTAAAGDATEQEDGGAWDPGLGALGQALCDAAARELPSEDLVDPGFTRAVEVCGADAAALSASLAALIAAAERVARGAPQGLTSFLRRAPGAAAQVAGQRPEAFAALLDALAGWTLDHADAGGLEAAMQRGLGVLADAAGADPGGFVRLLPPLAALARLDEPEELLERALPAARAGAGRDERGLAAALEDLLRLGAGGADPGLLRRIEALTALVREVPSVWGELIVPACLGLGAGAPVVLDCVRHLARDIQGPEDVALLKELVTQHGVRAPDLLTGLLYAGRRQGQIGSLGGERELLLAFVREVPFADPDYYAEYRRIMRDEALGPAERRARVEALHAELAEITAAVAAGEVAPAQEAHPLFGQVLSYVFPAGRSVSREDYLRLYRAFEDRPQDLAALAERGPLPEPEVRLATGGYRLRADVELDLAPWEPLRAVVAAVPEPGPADAPAELGAALFEAWIASDLGKPRRREELLTRIYRVHRAVHPGLPDALDDAATLIKYREFLADTTREIVQEALSALRAAQPERYERQARAKLDPRRRPGKGLLRAVWRTLEGWRAGALAESAARERLARQLKGYDLSQPAGLDALRAAPREALAAAIDALPAQASEVALGEEHTRVVAELVGGELAAMRRELFGDADARGKLEYSRESGGPELALRFEPTKRRAHAGIGLCEGVCTAVDRQLWDTPEFLQCVFWGPDRRARGGMHLLRVEREGQRALALPGINPSLDLLREVGPEALLDAALGYARALARAWQLDEVWVPTHYAIATNRGPIRHVLEERALPVAAVPSVSFSHSPYRYTFDEVWVVG
ncbi:MAG: hypothetical protein AB7N76_37250 [Planctomycetota bacterium]